MWTTLSATPTSSCITCSNGAATFATRLLGERCSGALNCIFASFRSRNGEALKVAEKFQGGGHANAAGAILPKSTCAPLKTDWIIWN